MDKSVLNHLPKAVRIKEDIKGKVYAGQFGGTGDDFLSVRGLAEFSSVSIVTAQRIMKMLKEDGVVSLEGGRHVLKVGKREKKEGLSKFVNDKLIGMVVTNIENPFFAALAREMEEAARRESLQLMIASTNYDVSREKNALEMFAASGVRGIISCPGVGKDVSGLYSGLDTPFVFVGRKLKGVDADSVLVENFNAAKLISEHFISNACENFAYLGIEGMKPDRRFEGFRYGLHEAGRELPDRHIFRTGDLDYAKVTPEVVRFLDGLPKPIAIFCFHDLLALLLIKASSALGLSIPGDVAIGGFDNLPFASKVTPSLTTVGYPLRSMAVLALNRLLEKTAPEYRASKDLVNLFVEPKLIVRETTSGVPWEQKQNIISNDLMYQAS